MYFHDKQPLSSLFNQFFVFIGLKKYDSYKKGKFPFKI